MSSNKLKIAIIGLGNIGKATAVNLVKGNRAVIVASKNLDDAKLLAKELGPLATAMEVPAAINEADIVVMAVWFSVIQELLGKYASELQDKIIVDPSNPIATDGKGGFKKIIDEKESAGQIIAGLLPKGAKFVKALGSLSAASLAGAARKNPEAVLFYAADDNAVKEKIEELIKDSGFDPLYVGKIDQSIRIEVFGDLHEFGALGKPVSKSELKQHV
jgi:predicted dinucleotide-binding enzyme